MLAVAGLGIVRAALRPATATSTTERAGAVGFAPSRPSPTPCRPTHPRPAGSRKASAAAQDRERVERVGDGCDGFVGCGVLT